MIINSEKIIGDCLETGFKLQKYMKIIDEVGSNSKAITEKGSEFQKDFVSYFRVRRSDKWRKSYFDFLAKQHNTKKSFDELLKEMYKVEDKIEASFVSKLIAVVNPNEPIWDSSVLEFLKLDKEWSQYNNKRFEKDKRIGGAAIIYTKIKREYKDFLNSANGKECVSLFNEYLPEYKDKIADAKKIDFFIWGQRGIGEE